MSELSAPAPAASPPELESAAPDQPDRSTRAASAPGGLATPSPADLLAIEHLVTEDDTPVDNVFSEMQQSLLTHSLRNSWSGPGGGRPFVTSANVGVFRTPQEAPLVPDVFLSLDVSWYPDEWAKPGRSYFMWEYGKPPDVVIEVVSNREGSETGEKYVRYGDWGVPYYVIFDPRRQVQESLLRVYELSSGVYAPRSADKLPGIGLGLQLWRGEFEGKEATWLRWQDASGALIPTGEENTERERNRAERERNRAEQERNRAERERNRAEQAENRVERERHRAEQAESRAERLAAQLRALGAPPENGESSS